nr:TetR/AcrR family transcriptional regulator [Corynebacterium suranareeae]
MSGLRETKKAATRAALSRAAAKIALFDGPEALTVASIAAAAGVSPRTFHNYFQSREDALFEFMVIRVQELTAQLDKLPVELDPRDAIEQLVVTHLRDGDSELNSFSAMFRIGEILETLESTTCSLDRDVLIDPLVKFLRARDPHLDEFDAAILIHLNAAAIATSLQTFYRHPEPRDVEDGVALIRRACSWIKR